MSEQTATTALYGTPVVPGIAYAPATWITRPHEPPMDVPDIDPNDYEAEYNRFAEAANTVSARLQERAAHTVGSVSDVLRMTSVMATDPGWLKEVSQLISHGKPAIQATVIATEKFSQMFRQVGGLMAERVTDLEDIRDRVIAYLQGAPEPGIPILDHPVVLLADDIAPADAAGLDPTKIMGIATLYGGPTSHTSIISRQLGIPCIVAARKLKDIDEGTPLLLDAETGRIELNPDDTQARALLATDIRRRELATSWRGPAHTADGVHIELLANIQDDEGARNAAAHDAEGVGLFRTELCFLGATTEPSVDEQARIYHPVFEAFPHNKVVIRTLDAGSDKPVVWASVTDENNPALGVRGLRTSGIDPHQLPHQLDAIARAARGHSNAWVMAPMVATISEARWFAQLVHERSMTAGIMVEVPAVAVLAHHFLREVDFVSIGTNDLTQYTMAADRMNPNLATYTDAWQPAVLALIARTARAGEELHKPVGVCGEAAADPLLACVLHGMGVTSLSMAVPAISGVGAQFSQVSHDQCVEAAHAVLEADSADDARAAARRILHN